MKNYYVKLNKTSENKLKFFLFSSLSIWKKNVLKTKIKIKREKPRPTKKRLVLKSSKWSFHHYFHSNCKLLVDCFLCKIPDICLGRVENIDFWVKIPMWCSSRGGQIRWVSQWECVWFHRNWTSISTYNCLAIESDNIRHFCPFWNKALYHPLEWWQIGPLRLFEIVQYLARLYSHISNTQQESSCFLAKWYSNLTLVDTCSKQFRLLPQHSHISSNWNLACHLLLCTTPIKFKEHNFYLFLFISGN